MAFRKPLHMPIFHGMQRAAALPCSKHVMRRSALWALLFNLIAVYVLWGSTAPAIRVVVQHVPPFLMAGIRFLIAGGLMWGYVRFRRVAMPTAREWWAAALGGITLLVLGNGVFSWTLQYLPSNVGALFFSLSPLFMALFAFAMYRERLSGLGATGLAIGLGGMCYLLLPRGAGSPSVGVTVAAVFSAVAWAFGSIVQRRVPTRDLVQGSAMQMLAAGSILIVIGATSGERLSATQLTGHAILAWAYLVVFGSIVGYSCYLWLMRNVPTTLASTYAYVNPVVSIVNCCVPLHTLERVTVHTLVAAAIIIAGVALMMLAPKPAVPATTRRAA